MSGLSSASSILGQPSDQDVVMNPPSASNPTSTSEGHSTDLGEKYKTLKRRFDEIEQEYAFVAHADHQEVNSETELQIDARIREERDRILSGMKQIEQAALGSNDAPSQTIDGNTTISSSSNGSKSPLSSLIPHHISAQLSSAPINLRSPRGQAGSSREAGNEENGQQSKHVEGSSLLPNSNGTSDNSLFGHTSTVPDSPQNAHGQSLDYKGQEAQHQPPTADDVDIDMLNSNDHGGSNSRHPSSINSHMHTQKQQKKSSGQPSSEVSTKRETRSTRQTRNTRNEGGNVIAAVAAATAEAEAAATAMQDGHGNVHSKLVASPSSTLAHALGPSNEASSSKETSSASLGPASTHLHMESILKVAEAAVAAQRAAVAANEADKSNSLPANADSNLDPSLFSGSNGTVVHPSQSNNTPSSSVAKSSNAESNIGSSVASNAVASSSSTPTSTSTSTTTTPTPVSSLSNNPYLGLSTNLLPRANGNSTNPTAHPMLMPYPFFYPPPAAPGTPNPSPYPMHYNPYYYLAAPMIPGANGMYPPANFPPPAQQQHPPPEPQKPKAKRLKAHTVTTKSFSIPMVPRDKKGKPMLPLNVGIMTVISLGDVCMRDHFHTERYIFPVGYEVTRRYLSTVDPTIEVVYHCTILDGGDGPKFQIIPSDRPDKPIIAGTATGAWSNIVKQANAIRNRQHSNSVSGPDFFGLGQNTIKHLIQELPNADRLRDYVWQNFVEGGPLGGRHAAVIPALPEEYDASLPIGAYYPKRETPINPNVPRGLAHYPQHIIAQAEAQQAQKLAAQASQEQPIAGPSGSSSSTPAQQPQPTSLVQPQPPYPQPTVGMMGNLNGNLNIHEYQPPAPQQVQPLEQTASQAGDKRTTRSSTAGTAPGSTSPASLRNSRSASRSQQQQQDQQQLQQLQMSMPVNGGIPHMGADGMMPTTFAGIMNAYPVPGVPPPSDSSTTPSS